ncbi:MAG: NAD-dependent epimerase/dehydratase family protein [Deltaproteobacteria bacterium]|nr:NAD-dependent epimerase/dehydratase family protein [Deltaproteobacteria bacterium]
MKTRKAVITGGTGFIGTHLSEILIHNSFEVRSLTSNQKIKKDLAVTYWKGDIRDLDFMRNACKDADVIFHCAAKGNMTESFTKPFLYHDVNVNGTATVLEAARLESVKKVIFLSSAMCYGIPDEVPTSESAPISPTNPYATSKVMAERLLLDWGKYYRIPVVSLRLSLVYGPLMSKTNGTIFSILFPQRLHNLPLTVCNDGNQRRDFVHVQDVCRAALAAFESHADQQVFNIGGGVAHTVNELIRLIGGSNILRVHDPRAVPDHLELDITRAKNILRWSPEIDLNQGVQELLDDIRYWSNETPLTPLDLENRMNDWTDYQATPSI